jgi:putative MATE family efflux protein
MKDLTVGNERKLILLFAMPMLLGNVFQQLYNIIDSIIVGNFLGKEALAAVGASFPVMFVLISLIVGVSSGFTIVIAQYFGAKDFGRVKRTINTLIIFLFISSIVLTIVGLLFSRQIFELMALPAHIIPQAVAYFDIFMYGLIFMFGYNGVSSILRGLGDSKTPLYFLMIATVLNIILVIVFIEVFQWGIAGVAWATVIAQGVSFVLSVFYLLKYNHLFRLSRASLHIDKEIFIKSIKIGIPTGLQHTFLALGMVALMRIVNDFGTDTIAAYSVAGRIDSFASLPAMNFAMALATFVGQNIGANKVDRVKKGFKATLVMTTIISLFVTLVVALFGHGIMSLFTQDQNVIHIGANYLVIVSAFYIVFSAMMVSNGVMRGAGDTLIPMFITLFALWLLRIPVSYWLSQHIGSDGIWWSIPIAWVFGCAASFLYYFSGRWKRKAIISPVNEV